MKIQTPTADVRVQPSRISLEVVLAMDGTVNHERVTLVATLDVRQAMDLADEIVRVAAATPEGTQ